MALSYWIPVTAFFGVFQVWLRVFVVHNSVGKEVPTWGILPATLSVALGTIMIAGPWIFIALLLPLHERVRYNHFIGGTAHEMNVNYVKGSERAIVGRAVPGVLMSMVPFAIIAQREIHLIQQIWNVWHVMLFVVMIFLGALLVTSGILIKSNEVFLLKLVLVVSGFTIATFVLIPLGMLGLLGAYLYAGGVFFSIRHSRPPSLLY